MRRSEPPFSIRILWRSLKLCPRIRSKPNRLSIPRDAGAARSRPTRGQLHGLFRDRPRRGQLSESVAQSVHLVDEMQDYGDAFFVDAHRAAKIENEPPAGDIDG